jgi:hypothetical protein
MSYQLYDSGASIQFIFEGGSAIYILKQSIRRVTVIREDLLKIEIMNRPAVYFRRMDVTEPVSISAEGLVNSINIWIENCLCHQDDDGGPIE